MQGRGRTPKEPVAVPMELLTIRRGQKRRGLLIGDQQATLVRRAAQRPDDKQADIGAWVGKSTTMMARTEKDFGLKVDKQPAKVQGRLLPAPVIQYGSPQHYYAGTTGAWNMKDVRHPPPYPIAVLWWFCVRRCGTYATRRCRNRHGGGVALGGLSLGRRWVSAAWHLCTPETQEEHCRQPHSPYCRDCGVDWCFGFLGGFQRSSRQLTSWHSL